MEKRRLLPGQFFCPWCSPRYKDGPASGRLIMDKLVIFNSKEEYWTHQQKEHPEVKVRGINDRR